MALHDNGERALTVEERVEALETLVAALLSEVEMLKAPRKPTLQEQSEAFLRRIHGGE